MFLLSLSESAFTWFISLPPNSIITWADLEKQFHKYFFAGVHEKKLTNLVRLRQRNDESVENFVQRLRDVKNKCYSLVLDDRQLAVDGGYTIEIHIQNTVNMPRFQGEMT